MGRVHTSINSEYHHYEVYMEDIWKYQASSHSWPCDPEKHTSYSCWYEKSVVAVTAITKVRGKAVSVLFMQWLQQLDIPLESKSYFAPFASTRDFSFTALVWNIPSPGFTPNHMLARVMISNSNHITINQTWKTCSVRCCSVQLWLKGAHSHPIHSWPRRKLRR